MRYFFYFPALIYEFVISVKGLIYEFVTYSPPLLGVNYEFGIICTPLMVCSLFYSTLTGRGPFLQIGDAASADELRYGTLTHPRKNKQAVARKAIHRASRKGKWGDCFISHPSGPRKAW